MKLLQLPLDNQTLLFLSKIKEVESGCWEWQACKFRRGYGGVFFKGKMHPAHRVSYKLFRGEIPEGYFVCHHCDNPPCVNPNHLFLGTHQDNMDDGVKKQRFNKGEEVNHAKLEEVNVRSIHQLYKQANLSITEIAHMYNIDASVVDDILRGRTWKHLNLVPQDRKRGERLKFSKLNNEAVREIRILLDEGMHITEVASKFNVHRRTVQDIVYGKTWKHVE